MSSINRELLDRIDEIGVWGFLLGLLYLLTAGRAVVKFQALRSFTKMRKFNVAKFFVFCVTLCCALRAVSFFLIAILDLLGTLSIEDNDASRGEYEADHSTSFLDFSNTKKLYHNALILTLTFPDVMILSTYSLLVLLYAETFIQCREHTHLLASFKKQWFRGYLILIPTFFVIQLTLFLLFISNAAVDALLWMFIFVSAANFVVPIVWILLWMYLTVKFSGFPYKSALAQTKAVESRNAMLLWTVGRIVFGIMDVGVTAGNWYANIPKNARAIVMICTYVVAEIGPCIWSITSFYLEYIIQAEAEDSFIRNSMRVVASSPTTNANRRPNFGASASSPLLVNVGDGDGDDTLNEISKSNFGDEDEEPALHLDLSIDIARGGRVPLTPNVSIAARNDEDDDDRTSKSDDSSSVLDRIVRRRTEEIPQVRVVSPSEIGKLEFVGNFGSRLGYHVYSGETKSDRRRVLLTIVRLPPAPMHAQKGLVAQIKKLADVLNPASAFLPLLAISDVPSSMWLVRSFAPSRMWLSGQIENVSGDKVSWQRRVRIALVVARALKKLHSIGSAHGHMSTHCVLLKHDRIGRLVAELSGWEIFPVIQFQKSTAGELSVAAQAPSVWVPPARRNWTARQSDVFGFGITLWALLTWLPASRARQGAGGRTSDDSSGHLHPQTSASPGHAMFDLVTAMSLLSESASAHGISRGDVQKIAILLQSCVGEPPVSTLDTFDFACRQLEGITGRS